MKLIKKIIYTGNIRLLTGLHIGGSNSAMNIGGPDNFVVRNPIDNKPYIPGSSLKGKMRSLIEIAYGLGKDGEVSVDPNSLSGALFGTAADKGGHPSRLIVRDCNLLTKEEDFKNADLPYTESKTEVSINRVTAEATPRSFERVPAGADFELKMVLNIYEGDDETQLKKTLDTAINLLQDDYLGGSGSRGYGQVEITKKQEDRTIEYYENL